jgi:hypothetical protein
VGPQILHWVQFWGIAGKIFQPQTPSLLLYELPHRTAAVPGQLGEEALKGGYGVDDRALVVAEARLLPGKVICPDDPTIPLTAKGYAGSTAVFEADAVYWDPNRTMEVVLKEIDSADYVIAMRHGWLPGGKALVTMNFPEWATSDDVLLASGFIKSGFRTTSTPVYQLWRRARPPGLPPALPR